eukprot:5853263-Heterocapsa_arctica.AAC.1
MTTESSHVDADDRVLILTYFMPHILSPLSSELRHTSLGRSPRQSAARVLVDRAPRVVDLAVHTEHELIAVAA